MNRHVALIIETSSAYGRGLLKGVTGHMRAFEEWSVFLEQRDLPQAPPPWLSTWRGDGILSRTTTPELADAVRANGVPLVELTDRAEGTQFPQVRSDDRAIGELAADHLLARGFRHFAFCGYEGEAWSDRRATAFREAVAAEGFRCEVRRVPWYGPDAVGWENRRRDLARWLENLPRPVGVMACNDVRAVQVLDACMEARLPVPERVAVVGVDDDELLCRVREPPLTSVAPDAEGVGRAAARLLTELMDARAAGRPPAPPAVHLVPPLGISTRQSTDVVAIAEPKVAAALNYIRRHAHRGITVNDVLREVVVSRSMLERRLRDYLGRSPQQEIRHVQIGRAKELLTETGLSVEKIAARCGFKHPEYLSTVFKRLTGLTPGEYRRADHTDPDPPPRTGR